MSEILSYFASTDSKLYYILGLLALIYGLVYLAIFSLRFIRLFYHVALRPGKNLLSRYGKSYAVITGSTSGIGYEFAVQLAKKGFNIILVSRNEQKLKQSMENIQKIIDNKVDVQYVIADFQQNSSIEYYENVANQINQHDVGLLVLNAGVMPIGKLAETDPVGLKAMVDVNCLHHVLLTRFILPKMLLRQNKSGMIHTSSVSSIGPQYGNVTYAATKVFDDYLAQGIRHEVGNKVDVLSLKPAGVITDIIQIEEEFKKQVASSMITSETCVKSALDSLGYDRFMYPGISHKVQGFLFETIAYLNFYGIFTKEVYRQLKNGSTNKKVAG